MIFQRTLLREFAQLAGAVFLTLFLIALTTRLVRLLGQAAGGKIPSDAVVAYLGFFALNALPLLLSLTLFITVLLTLARTYRDSEMVIWFSSGLSLTAWIRPVLVFALPLVSVIAALSLVIAPWSVQMAEQYRSRVDTRDDVSRVDPGVFGEIAVQGPRVLRRVALGRPRQRAERVRQHHAARPQRRHVQPERPDRGGAQRRSLHRAARGPPLRGRARRGRVPRHGIRALCGARRGAGRRGAAPLGEEPVDARAGAESRGGQPRRAAVAHRRAGLRA